MKELQSGTSVIILPDDKARSTYTFDHEEYLENCMYGVNNGSYQLIKKTPATTIKMKIWNLLKGLKRNEFHDNTLYCYLEVNDLFVTTFYGQLKVHRLAVSIHLIV